MKTNMRGSLIQICLLAAALLTLPPVVQAQFTYTTTNGTITITGYTGSGGAVTIPDTINGLPVTSIANGLVIPMGEPAGAFSECGSLTSVTVGNGVTNIGDYAFYECFSLTNITIGNGVTRIGDGTFKLCGLTSVTIPDSVTSIGDAAFEYCPLTSVAIPSSVTSVGDAAFIYCLSLTNVDISNGVASIGAEAFDDCSSLTSIIIPNSVTNIGDYALQECESLIGIYFKENPPSVGYYPFAGDYATVYYLPGTTGWDSTFAGLLTELWLPRLQTGDAGFGVRTNQFGFNINWASGQTVVVEACTNLVNPVWQRVQTNSLTSDSFYFSDPQWSNYPVRFYRLRSP
jgi:BspA type Leucine rich repeat region (6 copies)